MQEKKQQLSEFIQNIKLSKKLNKIQYLKAQHLYDSGQCRLLSSSADKHSYIVHDEHASLKTELIFDHQNFTYTCECGALQLCSHVYAAALQAYQDLNSMLQIAKREELRYSREGMIKRVLQEREERALAEAFHIHFADNKYGEHLLENDKGKAYRLSFYDFEKSSGYCSCPDYQTNKLATCKHLMYAFKAFKVAYPQHQNLQQNYPFVEIFCHPLHNYRISWYYPHTLPSKMAPIIRQYFDDKGFFKTEALSRLHIFLEEIEQYKEVKIRQEVREQAERYYQEAHIAKLTNTLPHPLPHILLKPLLPFQQEGIRWAVGKRACIMADELGLGKRAQALGAAIHKLQIFDMNSIAILCPASIRLYWQTEIEKWVPAAYHSYINTYTFENKVQFPNQTDILIIDEAQKINDYNVSVLSKIRTIEYKQMLLITDSKLENSLIKFYTMVGLFDKHLMNPLWEISYQHCLFDAEVPEKIVGYYHTDKLLERLSGVYLRRERSQITDQLPKARQILIPVAMHAPLRHRFETKAVQTIKLLRAKQLTAYDISQVRNLLQQLINLSKYNFIKDDIADNIPKLKEFIHFAKHKIHFNGQDKAVVFVDNTNLQYQLKRRLNEERIAATLSTEAFAADQSPYRYLITKENLQDMPSGVQHYIYFHLPENPLHIQSREDKIKDSGGGLQQAQVYIIQTPQSMETLLYQWTATKPHFLEQLMLFLKTADDKRQLSASLQETLSKHLLSYTQTQPELTTTVQMSLFAENTAPAPTIQNKETETQNNDFETFTKSMLKAFQSFITLDSATRNKLLEQAFEIKETDKEWHIILKK